jgi:hypothetical protein
MVDLLQHFGNAWSLWVLGPQSIFKAFFWCIGVEYSDVIAIVFFMPISHVSVLESRLQVPHTTMIAEFIAKILAFHMILAQDRRRYSAEEAVEGANVFLGLHCILVAMTLGLPKNRERFQSSCIYLSSHLLVMSYGVAELLVAVRFREMSVMQLNCLVVLAYVAESTMGIMYVLTSEPIRHRWGRHCARRCERKLEAIRIANNRLMLLAIVWRNIPDISSNTEILTDR